MPGFSSDAADRISESVKFIEQFEVKLPTNSSSTVLYPDDHCDILVQNKTGQAINRYEVARLGDPTFPISGEDVDDVPLDKLVSPTFEIEAPLGYGFDDVIVSMLEYVPEDGWGYGRVSGLVYCRVEFNYDFWLEDAKPTFAVGMEVDTYDRVITEYDGARICHIYDIDGIPFQDEEPGLLDTEIYWCLIDLRGQQSE